jgi:uncharacterized NAD-dependent epimerase/dehydratase family protein
VVPDVTTAHALGANVLLVGIAPSGGKLTPAWRSAVLAAIGFGMDVEAGLHTTLAADPQISATAAEHRVRVRDLRESPADLDVPLGPQYQVGARVIHSVGSDAAIGKMSVTLELDRAARRRGLNSMFVATGQTGIAISGWGLAVDHVISDYVAGAAERLVRDGAERLARHGATHSGLLWVEGQGALLHPAYSGVTLGLLHGSAPDALVLCHKAGSTSVTGYPQTPIPPLPDVVAAYETAMSWVHPATVVAIGLNTADLDDAAARAAVADAEHRTGLPADDAVRFGPDRLLDAVLAATADLKPFP